MSAASSATTPSAAGRGAGRRPVVGRVVGIVLLVIAALLPFLHRVVPGVFDGPLDSPGVLHLVALMLVFGALAITYDLLFGYTGLLSFGHALYFALGVYGTVVVLTKLSLGLGGTLLVVAVAGLVVPLVIGLICLRVNGIAFAMVTLAFAQAGTIFVTRDPLRVTGGELGKALPFDHVPAALTGVLNTRNVYWVALVLLVVVYAVSRLATASPTGRVWQGIRENERRVEVLGLNPTWYKLAVFVLASFLATVCGVVYVLVVGGASPTVTTSTFTLTLLVMVVLGGAGRLWGAMLGGMLYTYLDNRLAQLATSGTVQDLPSWVRVPLSEPLFVLGLLFVIVVLYLPGGVAGLVSGRGSGSAGTRGPNRLRVMVRRGEARGSEGDDNESAPRREPPAMDSRTHEEVGQR
jgi:branched-chain amino acid transport system permease protein